MACEYGPMACGRPVGGERLAGHQAALTTLFDLMQRVQTRMRLVAPLTTARTLWRFGLKRRSDDVVGVTDDAAERGLLAAEGTGLSHGDNHLKMAPGFHRDGHGTRANPEFYHRVPVSSRIAAVPGRPVPTPVRPPGPPFAIVCRRA